MCANLLGNLAYKSKKVALQISSSRLIDRLFSVTDIGEGRPVFWVICACFVHAEDIICMKVLTTGYQPTLYQFLDSEIALVASNALVIVQGFHEMLWKTDALLPRQKIEHIAATGTEEECKRARYILSQT